MARHRRDSETAPAQAEWPLGLHPILQFPESRRIDAMGDGFSVYNAIPRRILYIIITDEFGRRVSPALSPTTDPAPVRVPNWFQQTTFSSTLTPFNSRRSTMQPIGFGTVNAHGTTIRL